MFLKTIEVQNFRSISTLKVEDLEQINIFTGENNCGKTTFLEAIFQLTGWQVQNLDVLSSLRSPSKQNLTDTNGFFYNMDDKTIVLKGFLDKKSYDRTVKIYKTKDRNDFNGQNDILQSSLSEKLNGQNPKIIKSKVNIENGKTVPNSFNLIGQALVALNCTFPSFKVFEHGNLIRGLSEIIKDKDIDKIVTLLTPIDKRIKNIQIVENSIFLDLEGFPKLLPIELSGDGLRRILSVILSIYTVGKGGFVMIDEVENGLHFSTMPKFWRGLINAAKEMEVQLFITTHNEELLQSLNKVAEEENHVSMQSKIKYYNLKRYVNDEIVAYKYDFEKFGHLISNGNEIR